MDQSFRKSSIFNQALRASEGEFNFANMRFANFGVKVSKNAPYKNSGISRCFCGRKYMKVISC
jgi:hypothetical protein